jgi:UDP-N-acetylmuramate dehydrogenase
MLNLKSENTSRDVCTKSFAPWKNQIEFNKSLAAYTSFNIGGLADIFFTPRNIENLKGFLLMINKELIPWIVIGGGTNILISDSGFRGAVIYLTNFRNILPTSKDKIYVDAGVELRKLVNFAFICNLSGLEFASGIPGTVGGALICNAGGKYGSMEKIVDYVDCITDHGIFRTFASDALYFGYRKCSIPNNHIVIGLGIKLQIDERKAVTNRMKIIMKEKCIRQPLNSKSAGCIFKNPPGDSAGAIIESVGLKGIQSGGAKISKKHANFILNSGGAKASDVTFLIKHIKENVLLKKGLNLETEIRFIGFEDPC